MYQLAKTLAALAAKIAPHRSSALRYLHLGKLFVVVFVGSHSKMYCIKLA